MHRLEHLEITVHHHRHRTPTVYRVTLNVTDEALIGVTVDKDLQIHHVAQPFVEQRHDTLNDDHGFWLYMDRLGQTVAEDI